MKVLGIESSCDETAVAIVSDDKTIHSHLVLSQIKEHQPYGGVVPEIAARAHMKVLRTLIEECMKESQLEKYNELDAIAVTAGPGLIGGVIVGVMMAKAISSVSNIPIVAVNHLEGHALTVRLTDHVDFPFLLLLVSGGHCQILVVNHIGQYEQLGETLDDALGEAFDKVAKMLGLGYPGGPIVEKRARKGNSERFNFPRSLKGRKGCNFSFSGLKTAVKRTIEELETITDDDIDDICASFQTCVADILTDRLTNAFDMYEMHHKPTKQPKTLVVAGGVAANRYLRNIIDKLTSKRDFILKTPPINLCTDNAAMIAWVGVERLKGNLTDPITFAPRARWPLDINS